MADDGKARGGRRRNKPLPPDPDQQFLNRNRQLQIIRDCVLPENGVVSTVVMKAVLKALDDRIGARNKECWPSQATLAKNVGLKDRKQVQRAIDALENDLSVIYVRRGPRAGGGRGGTVNHYRIVWNELALLCPTEAINQRDQSDSTVPLVADDQSDNYAGPKRQIDPTNGTVLSHEAKEKRPRSANQPPNPLSPIADLPPEWAAVVKDFQEKQAIVAELASEHRSAGVTAAEFRERIAGAWAVVELPENASKFEKPAGAVAWYLRKGDWPVDGVITFEQSQLINVQRRTRALDEIANERKLAAEAARLAELEATYGLLLDSLDEAELLQLIADTPTLRNPFYQRWLDNRPPLGTVRALLLMQLAATFERTPDDSHFETQEGPRRIAEGEGAHAPAGR